MIYFLMIFFVLFLDHLHVVKKSHYIFHWARLQLFAFSAQVFFRVVFKGASSCFLSGYLPGPDKEVRLPAVSAFNQRAAFSVATLTYTVKRLSQHWRSRLCVKRQTEHEGRALENKWIYVLHLFVILGSTAGAFF